MPVKLPRLYVNAHIIRDCIKRDNYHRDELKRNALKFLARNTNLSSKIRLKSQLMLNSMDSAPAKIHNRCVLTGNARSIIQPFRLCRTQFRELALKGELPGVKKGVW